MRFAFPPYGMEAYLQRERRFGLTQEQIESQALPEQPL